MTHAHTLGPWHVGIKTGHRQCDVYGTKGEQIAVADNAFTDLAEAQANAALIARAPELLAENARLRAALEAMLALMSDGGADELARVHHPDAINAACDLARAALGGGE